MSELMVAILLLLPTHNGQCGAFGQFRGLGQVTWLRPAGCVSVCAFDVFLWPILKREHGPFKRYNVSEREIKERQGEREREGERKRG